MGIFRFFLAVCVILFHLAADVQHIGIYAVCCFYVISGYLITLVLNKTYHFGLLAFSVNRFLRLFPAYYLVAIFSLILALVFQTDYANFHFSWAFSADLRSIFGNIFIVPWAFLGDDITAVNFLGLGLLQSKTNLFRLVPSTWSVAIELVCYFLLWLLFARKWYFALAGVVFGIFYHILVSALGLNEAFHYAPVPAALLLFSLGALIYFIKDRWQQIQVFTENKTGMVLLVSVILVFILNTVFTSGSTFTSYNYYANMGISFLSVLLLSSVKFTGKLGVVDRFLGDCSYPIFLLQYLGGFLAFEILKNIDPAIRSDKIFFLGSLISFIFSLPIVFWMDPRVQKIRSRIRPQQINDKNQNLGEALK